MFLQYFSTAVSSWSQLFGSSQLSRARHTNKDHEALIFAVFVCTPSCSTSQVWSTAFILPWPKFCILNTLPTLTVFQSVHIWNVCKVAYILSIYWPAGTLKAYPPSLTYSSNLAYSDVCKHKDTRTHCKCRKKQRRDNWVDINVFTRLYANISSSILALSN